MSFFNCLLIYLYSLGAGRTMVDACHEMLVRPTGFSSVFDSVFSLSIFVAPAFVSLPLRKPGCINAAILNAVFTACQRAEKERRFDETYVTIRGKRQTCHIFATAICNFDVKFCKNLYQSV